MNRRDNGDRVFDYTVIRERTTYQFTRKFFCRAIVEYNKYYQRLNADFLLSYTTAPGSVVYLGYGSLYENDDPAESFDPRRRKNSLFFKASYMMGG